MLQIDFGIAMIQWSEHRVMHTPDTEIDSKANHKIQKNSKISTLYVHISAEHGRKVLKFFLFHNITIKFKKMITVKQERQNLTKYAC